MARTRIKVCGIRTHEAATAASDAGADAVGFIFVRTSPRYIDPETAFEILSVLPPMVSTVGVVMNMSIDAFSDLEESCPTTYSQLHGSEDEALTRQCGPGVIRAIRFDADTIAAELQRWDAIEEVDAILVDGSAGGEGQAFEWAKLEDAAAEISKPIFLAGGLTVDNVGAAIRAVRPYGVDVSSGVEKERGVKDLGLIAAFCEAVRRADE